MRKRCLRSGVVTRCALMIVPIAGGLSIKTARSLIARSAQAADSPAMTARAFTVASLAAEWGVSEGLVRNLIRKGELRCFRPGNLIRIPAEEVERFQNTQSSGSSADTQSSGETMPENATATGLRPLTALERKARRDGFGRPAAVLTGPWGES